MTSPDPGAAPDLGAAAMANAARAVAGVADLYAGRFGEIATYLPGATVPGVRADESRVEVHLVVDLMRPIPEVAAAVHEAVALLAGKRPVSVHVDDVINSDVVNSDVVNSDVVNSDVVADERDAGFASTSPRRTR